MPRSIGFTLLSTVILACITACTTTEPAAIRPETPTAPSLDGAAAWPDAIVPHAPWPDTPITLLSVAAEQPSEALLPEPALTPPIDESLDLWAVMRKSMHMDLEVDRVRVKQEIKWLQRNPNYLPRLQERMQTYLPYVVREVALRDMPVELALLPIVESALDVYAFSHGGAAGPWQFIRGTARQYRLTMDDWYDGRRDIVASTDAALRLLTDLHNRYDDWFLALAAYNAGPGNVNRAKRLNPGAGYFDLALPRETRAYVPRLLAIAAVIKDPENFGLSVPEVKNEQSFNTVNLHSQFQLSTLASVINIPLQDLQHWNPAFARWATSPRGPHHAIIPTELEQASVQAAIDAWPEERRVDWREVTVRNGDTLSELAIRYKTDVQSLVTFNKIKRNRIRAGQKLLIPSAGQDAPPPSIAGADLIHVVQSGESLWTISRKYDVNLRKLMRTNQVGPRDPLAVGKKLAIPGHSSPGQTASRSVVRTVRYKVRNGDSLARIASKFNVTVSQIASWNGLDLKKYIQPGQALKLYVNVMGG